MMKNMRSAHPLAGTGTGQRDTRDSYGRSDRLFITSTLKMQVIRSSETSVHTIFTRRHISEDGILHTHRRENLKSYIFIT
jgi:hypothetical protein